MSLAVNVEVEGLKELTRDLKKAGVDTRLLVTGALANSTERGKQEIRSRAPHAFGTLQRSVLAEVNYPVGEVSVQESYGVNVEEGTGPHMPPPESIERWVNKKGIPKSALWPIIMTIKKRGTRAQPFFQPGWEAAKDYVEDQFDIVMDKLMSILQRGK